MLNSRLPVSFWPVKNNALLCTIMLCFVPINSFSLFPSSLLLLLMLPWLGSLTTTTTNHHQAAISQTWVHAVAWSLISLVSSHLSACISVDATLHFLTPSVLPLCMVALWHQRHHLSPSAVQWLKSTTCYSHCIMLGFVSIRYLQSLVQYIFQGYLPFQPLDFISGSCKHFSPPCLSIPLSLECLLVLQLLLKL